MRPEAIFVVVRNAVAILLVAAAGRAAGDFNERLKSKIARDSGCKAQDVRLDRSQSHDFAGDGKPMVILVASTCNTGTAGPDVHSVLAPAPDGTLQEVPRPEVSRKFYASLFGNRNYKLYAEKNFLVEDYKDSSGRAHPLKIKYRWERGRFVVESIEQEPAFKASFDCRTAKEETDLAVCYVKNLAGLDVRLDEEYRSLLDKLDPAAKRALAREERKWRAGRALKCPIDKGWVKCLSGLYKARVRELKRKAP